MLAVWVALALAAVSMAPKEGSLPADESDRTPSEQTSIFETLPLVESGELPATFPATLPLPKGVRPVASRGTMVSVQVWFRSQMRTRDLYSVFEDSLRHDGWRPDGSSSPFSLPGIWNLHVQSGPRSAIVLGLKDEHITRLLHGSDEYPPGKWDLYIIVT